MEEISFPSESRALAALEQQLGADISLSRIEEIAQQIVTQTTEKTRGIADLLLNKLEAKKESLLHKQLKELDETHDPILKIARLKPLIYFLSPEEVEWQFDAIVKKACESDRKTWNAVNKKLQDLYFETQYPIVLELDKKIPNNFIERILNLAKTVLKTNSNRPLDELNEVQRTEVLAAIARNV